MGIYKDRVTIYEVAKASGVSLATVSRVINNQSNVTPETRKKVEDTIARLGYQPNALAQGLATNRTWKDLWISNYFVCYQTLYSRY